MSELIHHTGIQQELFSPGHGAYELLVGHYRTDGSFKSTEQLQTEYVNLTDELVRQMTEGVFVTDRVTGERIKKVPDFVVWLDKSARPVQWLTSDLWPILAADSQTGEVPSMPKSRFINIDREQWVNTVDPSGNGHMDIGRVDQSIIRSLRSVFVEPKLKTTGLDEKIDNAMSELDGKTVLIVDEVRSSGNTLKIAQKFFERAFPTTSIATTHWMKATVNIGNRKAGVAEGNADLPVWYREDTEFGRGVGNRDERDSRRSSSRTQRLGGWFLSTALPKVEIQDKKTGTIKKVLDPESKMLRHELHQLAEDVRNGEILVVPSLLREDYDERVSMLNHGIGIEAFKQKKHALDML